VLDWLAEQGETLDACVVGEPSNPEVLGEEIKIGRRGSLNGVLAVRGKQGHVAYPHAARNPIPGLMKALGAFLADRLDDGTEHFAPSNLEITSIDVGNPTTNIVPAEARAQFNIRYNDRHDAAGLEARLRSHCIAALAGSDLAHTLRFERSGDAFLTEPGPLVAAMCRAIADTTGRTPRLTTGGGTSDARFIKNSCPVIEFGPVNATIHQVDERVAVADLITLTKIYQRFMTLYPAAA
ncbi:MAG: succinyl-diaminopimelate desuccinylase, partial [Hyphomicrobiaceae bacterium]